MPDQLRHFADTFKNEVEPPDFDVLARESRRRRRNSVIASGVAVTVVVLGFAVWGRAATHDRSAPPVDRTPTPTAPTHATSTPDTPLTADEVVDDPSSEVGSLAVSPTDPDVAAAVWWHCATKNCNHYRQAALAFTTDNWRTRSTRLLASFATFSRTQLVVNALSDGSFIVHRDTPYGKPRPVGLQLLDSDLGLTPLVQQAAGSSGLGKDEAMPVGVFGQADAWAVDPATGTYRDLGGGHTWKSAALTPNGIIVANTGENRAGYSLDSGASWRFVPVDAATRGFGRWSVAAAEPGTIAAIEATDSGCEGGCMDTLDISRDSGATWSRVDLGGYIGYQAVITSQGSLLFVGGRYGGPGGILRSTADSLGDLHVVLDRADAGVVARLDLSESGGTETITACDDDGRCHRSVDDGRTWSEFDMR